MMRKPLPTGSIKAFICIIGLFLFAQLANSMTGAKELSESDNGKTVTVKQGSTLNIRLSGNITTGYSWDISSVDGVALKQMGKIDYVSDIGFGVGRGGTFTAHFRALQPGVAVVKMQYARPWEREKPPAKLFSVNVRVLTSSSP